MIRLLAPQLGSGHVFEPIAQRIIVAALKTPLGTLALPCFNQVLEAARALDGGLATLGATLVALHP